MALPSSGPISMSMINIEIGDDFNQGVSFASIASDFNLSAPNYGDSKLGLGLDELYGLSPSLTAVFSDFAVSSFNVNSQNGSVTSNPTATAGSDPLVSLTIDYVGDPFSAVLTNTTRTADIDLTVPAESAAGNPYVNQGSTLSGQVTSTQAPYEFEFDDWTGGALAINPNSGVVSFSNGNDSNAPAVVTNNTTFTQVSSSPGAGEYSPNNTSFGTFSSGTTTRTITFTVGVPGGSQDGGSGAYGNQGTTVTGTNSVTQFARETIASNPTGSSNSGVDLIFAYNNTTSNQTVTITVGGGDGSVDHTGTIISGHSSGGGSPSSDFYISTDSSFPVNSFSAGYSLGNGSPTGVYYIKAAANNTAITSNDARIIFSTTVGGAIATVLLRQEGNVIFSTSPAGGSSIVFSAAGVLTSGDNSIDLTTNTGLDWHANVTGSGFSVTPSSGTSGATIVVSAASHTGAARSGTLNIDSTTSGVTGVLKTFTLSQLATPATGTVKYNGGSQSVSVGSFGTAITIGNTASSGASNGIPSPSFMDFRVHGANYNVTYTAQLSASNRAGLSTTFSNTGAGVGSVTLSNLTATTSNTGTAQFYCNINSNDTTSSQTFTLTLTFDDNSSASTTTFDFTLDPIPGGGGGPGDGGDDGGPGDQI
tara:strand:- start:2801 stop:4741 length:1941 start_codon:yes stop_codon:yes gene_type:complete